MKIQRVEISNPKMACQGSQNSDKSRFIPNFCAAKDMNLRYILDRHSQELPVRMFDAIQNILKKQKSKLPTLHDLHLEIYQPLIRAKSLQEVKKYYPEFEEVVDLCELDGLRSKAADGIKNMAADKEFTLDLLKLLYAPMRLEDIAKFYDVQYRSAISYLMEILKIPKLSKTYIRLFSLSDEVENRIFAEKSLKALKTPEAIKKCNENSAAAHRTPEYREKKRQEMIDFYKRTPDAAERVRMISQMTWDRCPEIKAAMALYTAQQTSFVLSTLAKRTNGARLNTVEKRAVASYYKKFWDAHPDLKKLYSQRKLEVVEELKKRL